MADRRLQVFHAVAKHLSFTKAAETQIAAARASAVGALRQVASETTSVVVARLTGISANQQAVDAAVGAVLASRGQA